MKVVGQAMLNAPIDRVWAALNDEVVLEHAIPGCQRLQVTGPDAYAMTVTAGVASIKGSYTGTVQLSDQQPPNSFVMTASGAGGPGSVTAEVRVRLTEQDAGTVLDYEADAVVGGVIGGVGQRMLAGVAKKMAGEFFAGVDDVLSGRAQPRQPASAPAVTGAPAAAGRPTATGTPTVHPAVPTTAASAPAGAPSARDFIAGAVFGAVTALLGVLVGARTARNSRTATATLNVRGK